MHPRTKILALDHGEARVGLAVSCVDRRFSFPLEVRERAPDDASYFRMVIEREGVGLLLVGLPVHMSGDEGTRAKRAREFGTWLGSLTGLPVAYFDERFTTASAETALWDAGLTHKKRKQRRDMVAAQMLLQAFLDAGCPLDAPPETLEGRQ